MVTQRLLSGSVLAFFICLAGCDESSSDPSDAEGGVRDGGAADGADSAADANAEDYIDACMNGDLGALGALCTQPCEANDSDCSMCCDPLVVCGEGRGDVIDEGQACDLEGRTCSWAPACGGEECACVRDGAGDLVWACFVRPC